MRRGKIHFLKELIPIKLDTIYTGDSLEVLKTFPDDSIQCCVTSPPYYALRDYGMDGQIGREDTPQKFDQCLPRRRIP